MAVTPTFVVDVATLKKALRLSGLTAGGDGEAVLFSAIQQVKLKFYQRLGATKLAALQALVFDDTPDDADEFLRLAANELEIKWVRRVALEVMPTLFMDASGNAQEVWNEESPFRQGKPTIAELRRLDSEIERDLVFLKTGKRSSAFKSTTIEPDDDPGRPGDSLALGLDAAILDEDLDGLHDEGAE